MQSSTGIPFTGHSRGDEPKRSDSETTGVNPRNRDLSQYVATGLIEDVVPRLLSLLTATSEERGWGGGDGTCGHVACHVFVFLSEGTRTRVFR